MATAGRVKKKLDADTRESDAKLDTEVLQRVVRRLHARASDFREQDSLDDAFVDQVRSILGEARQLIRDRESSHAAVSVEYGDAEELAAQGELRAEQNQHPAEALMAAEVLFDEALPPFLEWADATDVEQTLHVVRCLHRAIWRRFPPGAIAYTEALRQKLSTSHLESRRRLSRDLHDRIAHGIAAGVQRLDLLRLDALATNDQDVAKQVAHITTYLRAALTEVQDMAVDLRSQVGKGTLLEAVRAYVIDSSDIPPRVHLSSDGDEFPLSSLQSEETLTIIQEALHNSRRHAANATRIDVHFSWKTTLLEIDIRDDGSGFSLDRLREGALGLTVMRERAENSGSRLIVSSEPGQGTTVSVTIPKSRPEDRP